MDKDETKKTKANKTWILIAILVAITAILLTLSLTAKNSAIKPIASEDIKKEKAQTSLIFSDEIRIGSTSGTYEIDININTDENKITLAQLELSYDPNMLSRIDIRPGSFIDDPAIIQKSINIQEGRIKYWIGVKPNQNGTSGKGVIATLSFAKSGSGSAQIDFLPKTYISTAGSDKSVLKNMISGYIFNLPTPSPKLRLSPIPSNIQQ